MRKDQIPHDLYSSEVEPHYILGGISIVRRSFAEINFINGHRGK